MPVESLIGDIQERSKEAILSHDPRGSVGICIPYSAEHEGGTRILKRVFECIKDQSYKDLVIHVAERGPNDPTVNEFCKDHSVNYSFLQSDLFDLATLRDEGALRLDTDYIFFLDQDMLLHPTYFDTVLRFFSLARSHDVEPIYYGARWRKWKQQFKRAKHFLEKDIDLDEYCNEMKVVKWYRIAGNNMMFSKKLFEKTGLHAENFRYYGNEDYEFCARAYNAGATTIFNSMFMSLHVDHSYNPIWTTRPGRKAGTTNLQFIASRHRKLVEDDQNVTDYIARHYTNINWRNRPRYNPRDEGVTVRVDVTQEGDNICLDASRSITTGLGPIFFTWNEMKSMRRIKSSTGIKGNATGLKFDKLYGERLTVSLPRDGRYLIHCEARDWYERYGRHFAYFEIEEGRLKTLSLKEQPSWTKNGIWECKASSFSYDQCPMFVPSNIPDCCVMDYSEEDVLSSGYPDFFSSDTMGIGFRDLTEALQNLHSMGRYPVMTVDFKLMEKAYNEYRKKGSFKDARYDGWFESDMVNLDHPELHQAILDMLHFWTSGYWSEKHAGFMGFLFKGTEVFEDWNKLKRWLLYRVRLMNSGIAFLEDSP